MSWSKSLVFLPLGACIFVFDDLPDGRDDWQPQVYVDEGDVCFLAGGDGVDVLVRIPECLSSSCSRDFVGTCSVAVDGNTITLQSDISWEQNVGDVTCTDDCGSPDASCVITGLGDGTYEVIFGDQTIPLTVPVEATACDRL